MTGCPDAFSLNPVPEIHFGPGHARLLADDVRALSGGTPARVLLVADAALRLEATFAWSVERDDGLFAAAARACGLAAAEELPDWYTGLMTRCGIGRRLPAAFAAFGAAALAAEMRVPENAPMRRAPPAKSPTPTSTASLRPSWRSPEPV